MYRFLTTEFMAGPTTSSITNGGVLCQSRRKIR